MQFAIVRNFLCSSTVISLFALSRHTRCTTAPTMALTPLKPLSTRVGLPRNTSFLSPSYSSSSSVDFRRPRLIGLSSSSLATGTSTDTLRLRTRPIPTTPIITNFTSKTLGKDLVQGELLLQIRVRLFQELQLSDGLLLLDCCLWI